MRFLIVGCGRMGIAHARRLANDPGAVLTGFYDVDPQAAIRLRDEFAPDAAVYASYEAALDGRPDAVIIGTPTSLHHRQITAALQAGMHVLAEKPLATRRAEIVALTELADACEHQFAVLGYQRRFWHNYRYLRSQVQSGEWGPVRSVTFITGERWEAEIAGTWRNDPAANPGGFLGDAGSHKIDALMYVTGQQPRAVFAITRDGHSQVPVVTSVCGSLDGGAPLTMAFTGHAHSYVEDLRISCEHAELILRDGRVGIARENDLRWAELPANESGPASVLNPVTGLLEMLRAGVDNAAPFACALPVFDVTAAILESSRTGQPVVIEPSI